MPRAIRAMEEELDVNAEILVNGMLFVALGASLQREPAFQVNRRVSKFATNGTFREGGSGIAED